MELNNESLPYTRKAFSADKSKKVDPFSECADGDDTTSVHSPSSASVSSKRAQRRWLKSFENLNSSESLSCLFLKSVDRDDNKLFLRASVTLEKLSKTIEAQERSCTSTPDINYKQLVVYRDVLKRLLEERCSLVLKEECSMSVKRTARLVDDFKQLYLKEKIKSVSVPTLAYHRFISSSDINLMNLEYIVKKLQNMYSIHESLHSSYQRVMDCFHVGFDIDLYLLVLKTEKVLKDLKEDVSYWASKIMELYCMRLALADPSSISPNFLENVLAKIHLFSQLVVTKDKKPCDSDNLSLDKVLHHLAFFEANAASEKTVHFVTSFCRKNKQMNSKKKSLAQERVLSSTNSGTSDYGTASASDSENSAIEQNSIVYAMPNFINVLQSILQRNQLLIIKYLYAITSVKNGNAQSSISNSEEGHLKNTSSARKIWDIPRQSIQDKFYAKFEENYWQAFWKNFHDFILRLLLEMPHHQYGDATAGSVILWSNAYWDILLDCLKMSAETEDIPAEARCVMKQIHDHCLMLRAQITWDIEFCSFLSSTNSWQCIPVPTILNQMRSHPGNLFCTNLKHLIETFSIDNKDSSSFIYIQMMQQLQVTLDSFLLWVNIKNRAAVSSNNISTFILISCSDLNTACELLKSKESTFLRNTNNEISMKSNGTFKQKIKEVVFHQMQSMFNSESESFTIIYNIYFSAFVESIMFILKTEGNRKFFSKNTSKIHPVHYIEELLHPVSEILQRIPHPLPVISTIVVAFSQALLFILNVIKRSISAKRIQILSSELSKFLVWLETLNLVESEREQMKQIQQLQKTGSILKLVKTNILRSRCIKQRNRVLPLENPDECFTENILTEDEKHHWQRIGSPNIFCSC